MTASPLRQSTGVYLTRLLRTYGVEVVFGIPGVHTVELYRGLDGSGLRHVTPRHEQGAGFMADGYARASGKPGVCFIISGPGMTNIITAMGQAYGDSIPMLVISTVNAHGRMGSGEGWLHELPNQSALVAGVSAFSRTVNRPEELAPALAQAFAIFDSARPRPVHIELPINVMLADASHLSVEIDPPRLARPAPPSAGIEAAAALLNGSETPVILAGGGAVRSAAKLRTLAEMLDAPVVMTTNARGILPADHPLGVSLSPSKPQTRALVAQADVVLALGTELGPTDYDFYEDGGFAIPGKLIRVDLDPAQIMRSHMPSLGLVGDVDEALVKLAPLVAPRSPGSGEPRARAANAGIADLPRSLLANLAILNLIRETLPDALIVGDSTQLVYAGNTAFAASVPGGYFNSATGFGTLGYGLPAAIGAAIAAPDRPIVALVGDGGLQFTLAELASAVEAKASIIMILLDNSGYGEIKSYMQSLGITPLGVDILTPDLAAIARACGWKTVRLETAGQMVSELREVRDPGLPKLLVINDQFGQDFD
jgi:acetolactate synthase-1/2/3 large subunit